MKKVASILIIVMILVASVLPSFAIYPNDHPYTYWLRWTTPGYEWQLDTTVIPIYDSENNQIIVGNNGGVFSSLQRYSYQNGSVQSPESFNKVNVTDTYLIGGANITIVDGNYSIGEFSPKSLTLNIVPNYYVNNTGELANRGFSVNQTGIDIELPISITVVNPQGISETTTHNFQFLNLMVSFMQLNDDMSFWTTGNYSVSVSCDGLTDMGVFTLERTDVPDSGVVSDSDGNEYEVEASQQAYISYPNKEANEGGLFYIKVLTNGQPYRLPNGKTTYSIYYYFGGNKTMYDTAHNDVTMTVKESRYWYSSQTTGKKTLVLYVGENPDGTAYSGQVGVSAKTQYSTWQHPVTGQWFIPIDIKAFNYLRTPTIDEDLKGSVDSPWREPGQTVGDFVTTPAVTPPPGGYDTGDSFFDWDNATKQMAEFLGGFSSLFSMIGLGFSFIPPQIMALGVFAATLSLLLLVFRR